ncbi:MAG TPA: hypothetical protein VFK05_00725 [Polyangiaceae bacterium]|nr:hypothetical protein [Polyangiaceae bacterium]
MTSELTLQALLPLPQNLNPSDVALGSSAAMYINDRVHVEGQLVANGVTTQYNGLVSYLGTTPMRVGADARIGTLLSRGAPTLADRSRITGSLYSSQAAQKGIGVTVTGFDQESTTFTTDGSWLAEVTWPTVINPAVNLDPASPTPPPFNLAPGAYDSVSVKAGRTLVLSAGKYYFGPWTQEPSSGLVINSSAGPVYVYMQGAFTFRGNLTGSNAPNMNRPSLTILSFASGLHSIERPFTGVVLAPMGSINLDAGSNARFNGAFIGRAVTVHEQSIVTHMRDPYSFRGFAPSDRVSVTGGIIQQGSTLTDDYEQAEAAAAVSRNGSNYNVTVTYNDRSQDPASPRLEYPAGRSGDQRIVHKGASLMGWSYSTDGGYTFNYGGRVSPPAGFSAIWGDPALAKFNVDDPNVYLAMMSATTPSFEASPGYDAATQSVINHTPTLDGHCVARSTDRGITFPTVACTQAGTFHDGSSLAVATDLFGKQQVYLTSHDTSGGSASVWRMDAQTMVFTKLPNPFSTSITLHPRLRHINGSIYVVAQVGTSVVANRLEASNNSTTWQGAVTVVPSGEVNNPNLPLADGRFLRQANAFSFDVGFNGAGKAKFRVIYTSPSDAFPGSGFYGLRTYECEPDLTGCVAAPWTIDSFSQNMTPSLRYAAGRWVATWWRLESSSSAVSTMAGLLDETGSNFVLRVQEFPTNPCASHSSGNVWYWGDYNELDGYGDGRFFAPHTVNGPGCRFSGEWTGDMHVGGSIFGF